MTKLQDRRKAAGLSQSGLAEKSGVGVRIIQSYEQEHRDINGAALTTGKALADALGCTIEDLIED
jgi:transcriptional regulator with XRE-family HTH domain